MKRINPKKKAAILNGLATGRSINLLAKAYKVTPQTIRNWTKNNEPSEESAPKTRMAQFVNQYTALRQEIAKEFLSTL